MAGIIMNSKAGRTMVPPDRDRGDDMNGRVKDADVLIVGAGPAGAAAARDLAQAGQRVLLLERPGGPGRKPCAGGVTVKALNRLRFPITPVVREEVRAMDFRLRGGRARVFETRDPVAVMTHRPEFDAYCLEQARAAGAQLREIPGIRSARQHGAGVELHTSNGETLSADWLVGADGAQSTVRRLLFGGAAPAGAMAIEGLLPRERAESYPVTRFDFGALRGGYGWLFPKGDHTNVGLYVWRRGGARPTREALASWSRAVTGSDDLASVQGFPLGTRGRATPGRGRVLLAGDAAGQVEALLGEGIYGAIFSGQQAAAALLGGGDVVARYADLLGVWQEEAARMNTLAGLFYGTLPLAFGGLKHGLGKPLMRAYARGETLGQGKRRWLGARFSGAGPDSPRAYSRTSGERPG